MFILCLLNLVKTDDAYLFDFLSFIVFYMLGNVAGVLYSVENKTKSLTFIWQENVVMK